MTSQAISSTVEQRQDKRRQRLGALGGAVLALTIAVGIGIWQVQHQPHVTTLTGSAPAANLASAPRVRGAAASGTTVYVVGSEDQAARIRAAMSERDAVTVTGYAARAPYEVMVAPPGSPQELAVGAIIGDSGLRADAASRLQVVDLRRP